MLVPCYPFIPPVLQGLDQWFSTFVRPRPGKFFFYKTRARYWAAARLLRNTGLDYPLAYPGPRLLFPVPDSDWPFLSSVISLPPSHLSSTICHSPNLNLFHPEDSMFLHNLGNHFPRCTLFVSLRRRPQHEQPPLWRPQAGEVVHAYN
jgi:hypothetical protein